MAKQDDDSVFKRIERLGFRQVKPTPQHLLQSLPLASQQQRQAPSQLSSIHAIDQGPAAAFPATGATSPQWQQLRQLKLSRNSSPPTGTLKVLRASSAAAAQYNLLPPLLSPSSLMRSGSNRISPYLDVSIAASAFNSSQPRSPPGQQRMCCSPSPCQQHPTSPSSCCTRRLRSSWDAGSWLSSDADGSAAAGSGILQRMGSGSGSSSAAVESPASSNPASAATRQQLSSVAKNGAGQQLQRQWQPFAGQPPNIVNTSNYTAALNRARRRKPGWDDNTNPPREPSFQDAIREWQQDMEAGAYGPKFLGSWAAVSSWHLNSATAVDVCGQTSSFKAGYNAVVADMPTVAFQGSGDEAAQALEGVVLKHLVGKPHLTLMQLQRGVLAISKLDSPFQLAAIGLLLRGGFWIAALQVAYADFTVLAEVLYEMKLVMETYLQWNSQLAAATWYWHAIDRDLFMRTFRGLDIIVQYQKLRKQVCSLQQLQSQSQQQLQAAGISNSAVNSAWASLAAVAATGVRSSSGRGGVLHPQVSIAEQQMLLNVLDHYLTDVDAALAVQATAQVHTSQRLVSVLEICPEAAEFKGSEAGVDADAAAPDISRGDAGMYYTMMRTLEVNSDWRISAGDSNAADLTASEQQHAPRQPVAAAGCSVDLKSSSSSSTAGVQSQKQPMPTAANSHTGLQFSCASVTGSMRATSKSSDCTTAASSGHIMPAKSHSRGCSSDSNSSASHPLRQRSMATSDSFTVQSVPADAITVDVTNTDAVLLQSPAASANSKGRGSIREAVSSSSIRSAKADHLLRIKTSDSTTFRQAAASRSCSANAAAAASPAKSGDRVAEHAEREEKFSAFGSRVSAAEVLGVLEAQQQEQEQEKVDTSLQSLKQQQVADEHQSPQPANEPAVPEADENSDLQRQLQEVTPEEGQLDQQNTLKGAVLAVVPESQQQDAQPQSEQHLSADLQRPLQGLETAALGTGQQSVLAAVTQAAKCKQEPQQLQQQLQGRQNAQDITEAETISAAVIATQPQQAKLAPPAKSEAALASQCQQPEEQPQQQETSLHEDVSANCTAGPGRPASTLPVKAQAKTKPQPPAVVGASTPTDEQEPNMAEPVQQEQHAAQDLLATHAAAATLATAIVVAAVPDPTQQPATVVLEPSSKELQQPLPVAPSFVQGAMRTDPPAAAVSRPASAVTVPIPQQQQEQFVPDPLSNMPAAIHTQPTAAAVSRPASAVTAPIPQQQQRGVPQAPASPCSRPQSHQTSRCNSLTAPRPGSAGILGRAGAVNAAIPPAEGSGPLPQVGRPASASAAAAAGATGISSWCRPGSSGSSRMRPASAAGSSSLATATAAARSSRPASAGGFSIARPASAGAYGADAVAASLQRLRDSCAQQRRDIEQAAQTIIEAAAGADGWPGVDIIGVTTPAVGASGSSRPASPVRPGSSGSVPGRCGSDCLMAAVGAAGSVAAGGSRPSSALRSIGLLPSNSSSSNRPQSPVHRLGSSSSRPQSPAGHLLGASADLAAATGLAVDDPLRYAGTAGAESPAAVGPDGYMAVSMQLHQVPEESSRAVLGMDHSDEQLDTVQQQDGATAEQQQLLTGEKAHSSIQAAAAAEAAAAAAAEAEAAGGETVIDGESDASPDQQQMQDELKAIVKIFQQRLEQTALMAQQLLAQQKAGQAARHTSSNSKTGSAANSRPGSASVGSRPCSVGAAAGPGSRCNVPCSDARSLARTGSGGVIGLRLTPHGLSALELEEPASAEEIAEYAVYLGMDPEQDADLLHIAESALTAPCPQGWTVHLDQDGNEFFYHPATQASTYEHPMDQHFRQLYQQKKRERQLR